MGKENEGKKTVEIPVEAHYLEEVVPPKCRKPRHRENVINTTIEVPVLSGDEAPVALVAKVRKRDEDGWEWIVTPYRLVNGKLYTLFERFQDGAGLRLMTPWFDCVKPISIVNLDEEPFVPEEVSKDLPEWSRYSPVENSPYAMIDAIQCELVMIDGELWRDTPEPAYELFELGKYNFTRINKPCPGDKMRLQDYRYNAAEWDEQVDLFRELYCKHGMDIGELEEELSCSEKIKVLIPEAVALPSSHEIDTMRELGSALKRLTDVQFDLNRSFGDEAYPGSYSLYEARCALTSKLAELLDELAVRQLRGCGDPESVEKLWCENPTEIDQAEVEERLRRYGIE